MNIIKRVPLPISGLMLALVSIGNLLASYNQVLKKICGILATFIFICLIFKIIIDFQSLKKGVNNPVVASVLPTFSMGLMILATYMKTFNSKVALIVWFLAIIIHIALVIVFTRLYLLNFDIKKVFPSYFIVYAGIVVASVTAPAFNKLIVGKSMFYFGFIGYLFILPVVVYRVYKYRDMTKATLPTLAIFTAPSNLCLAGYISAFKDKNEVILYFLILLSFITFTYAIYNMPKLLRNNFYPSYSAFTFPFVISAVATKKLYVYFRATGLNIEIFKYLYIAQMIISVLFVSYVTIKYTAFVLKTDKYN
ncbi:TDT family transporter [Clostridiaceae bacterium M8S5]|nr:TDT family transporter [Clostridiaceae bacterium M8S5]